MLVGLFFNHEAEAGAEAAALIRAADYGGRDVEFVTGDAGEDHGDVDIAVSIGGDGTFLLACKTLMGRGIPLYGIDTGRVGFLAYGDAGSAASDVRRIVEGSYELVPRIPLVASVDKGDGAGAHYDLRRPDITSMRPGSPNIVAFNEVTIQKKFVSRPIGLTAFVEGEKLYSFLSDGIIISTPAGSTAYALSAGGPVIHPDSRCVSIIPICAHSLSPRPMVVPDSSAIRIVIDSAEYGATLSSDGRNYADLVQGDEVAVSRSLGLRVDLIRVGRGSYIRTLRDKLGWE
jgi:NAD+ kinase